jgi:predicted secreted protein
MALSGRNAKLKVSATAGGAGTYTEVAELTQASCNINGQNIDISVFGDGWLKRIQGMRDSRLAGSGWLVPSDTNGQIAIRTALANGTELWAQFLWDGTNGFKVQVLPTSFDTDAPADGAVAVSCAFDGTGAIIVVP